VKQRTDEERRALLAAWRASGDTAKSFCRQHGISYESMNRWRRRPGVGATQSFLPVALRPDKNASARSSCEIVISEQVRIECYANTDTVALEKAIRAAVTACGRT
jgi:transposase-like protein